MMWKEPRIHELDAPPEYLERINGAIFFNRTGHLRGEGWEGVIQYTLALLLSWLFVTTLLLLLLAGISTFFAETGVQLILAILLLLGAGAYFYWWGWLLYEEAWYHFDNDNRIMTVIRRRGSEWEMIEIPYEQVTRVEWSGGKNGYATIYAADFAFDTTRADTQRFASVTELWPQLARFDTDMTNWPIILVCPVCEREFGHHLGTATCPFDEVILRDPQVKGRIDPEEMNPDDYSRL